MRQLLAVKVGPPAMVGQSRDVNWSVRLSGRRQVNDAESEGLDETNVMNEAAGGTAAKRNGRR